MLHMMSLVLSVAAESFSIIFGGVALALRTRSNTFNAGGICQWLSMVFAVSACLWVIIDWLWLRQVLPVTP